MLPEFTHLCALYPRRLGCDSYGERDFSLVPSWGYEEENHPWPFWLGADATGFIRSARGGVHLPTDLREDPDIVWKIDLGQKTHRRLVNGNDQCTRRIRRIYWSKDAVGSVDDLDA